MKGCVQWNRLPELAKTGYPNGAYPRSLFHTGKGQVTQVHITMTISYLIP